MKSSSLCPSSDERSTPMSSRVRRARPESPPDGPPLLIRPLPASPLEVSYYAKDLDLPTGATFFCHQLLNLQTYDPRLSPCGWTVIGITEDPTPEMPTYPFLHIEVMEHLPAAVVQVKVYLWQIYRLGTRPWAELRWHPTRGSDVSFLKLSDDAK